MRSFILLFLAASGVGFSACRRYAPVERHFLRVPAAYAAELSGIDRQKWLKRSRKLPGTAERAKEDNYLKLPVAALPQGMTAPEGEVKFLPKEEASRQGMVALHWLNTPEADGGRLWLLKTEGGRYVPQPLTRWVPGDAAGLRYSLTEEPGALVIYRRAPGRQGLVWRKAEVLRWWNGTWGLE